MDRRTFLGLTGGALVLGACGAASAGAGGGAGGQAGNPDLVLVPNDWDFFSDGPYRLSVLLAGNQDNGAPVPLDAPVTLRVGPVKGALGPPMPTVIHADGPQPAYALTTYRFAKPGVYELEATFKGRTASLPISVTDPANSTVPVVGGRMPKVATPTAAAPLGVNPVCTASPPCPFHTVSLDAALAAGKPVALLFATPALCQSKFCGPVLDDLVAVHQPWADRVAFIHCEIYTDSTGTTETPPVVAFNLEHEPMLYLVRADGVIATRIDNLFDKGEARDALATAFG